MVESEFHQVSSFQEMFCKVEEVWHKSPKVRRLLSGVQA